MKQFLIFICIILLFGCSNDDESNKTSSIVLLQVDYVTNVFEGGKEISISEAISSPDTIPISIDYNAPGDFGSIALYYQPTNEMIFNGTIIWMGLGQISFPNDFVSAGNFSQMDSEIEQPDSTKFQTVFYDLYNQSIDYANIWNAINNLELVANYLNGHKKIGLFLYTPSVGAGNPNDWDWFVILNK